MDNKLIKRYVSLQKRRRKAEDALQSVRNKIEEIKPFVVQQFAKAGLDQINMDGMTVYIKRQLWVKVVDRQAAVDALKAAGMSDYIGENFNSNSLSAFIREIEVTSAGLQLSDCNTLAELERQGVVLPPELIPLKDAVGVSEVIEPATRKE